MQITLVALALLAASPAIAGDTPPAFTIALAQRPEVPAEIALGTPKKPTMPPEQWQWINGDLGVRNVSEATLTPVLPPAGAETGAAVIVAPGGGFLGLAIDTEGYRVAHWLADHGIAAFVLKYRTLATPGDFATYRHEMIAVRTGTGAASFRPPADTPPEALADGIAALKLVRARAAEWRIDPARIGMMGFSAGAFTTLSVALAADPAARPAFIAPIYGPLEGVQPPADAPPMFVALASDDPLFWKNSIGLIESWSKAHVPVEFHLYQRGGHGFGLGTAGTTTVDWIEGFRLWLESNGMLRAR